MSRLHELIHAVVRRAIRSRRGSVIVLALAVLAILAILAVAYVSIVRVDRQSSVIFGRNANYQRQVDAVVSHMQGLIAADLFGNKVVTNSVPRRAWPKGFEDGETWDNPSVDAAWANLTSPPNLSDYDNQRNNNYFQNLDASGPISARVARPDDAWLAPTEPNWDNVDPNNNNIAWEQITNLRSAFTWRVSASRRDSGYWHRGDGRFVDLGTWFKSPRFGHADAGVDLRDNDGHPLTPRAGKTDRSGTRFGADGSGDPTGFFGVQIASLDTDSSASSQILEPYEQRFGIDTDGDLKMDARWQQLESLGNVFGLNWVVAARIIDASSLVNFQTAIEFPTEPAITSSRGRTIERVSGTGETPADIDMFRLFAYNNQGPLTDAETGVYDGQIRTDKLFLPASTSVSNTNPFDAHLRDGFGFEAVTNDLLQRIVQDPTQADVIRLDGGTTGVNSWENWATSTPLTRDQRYEYYKRVTSTVDQPSEDSGKLYPRREMIDFMSFWGTNNFGVLSKLEQRIDGPESTGYLPDPDVSSPSVTGPLRARAEDRDERRFGPPTGSANQIGQPTGSRLKRDPRHLLTAFSGTAAFSPVPILRDPATTGDASGSYSKSKIAMSELASISPDRMRQLFGDLVWALAPLATNQPLMPGVPNETADQAQQTSQVFHYGGGPNGPAFAEGSRLTISDVNAGYAVARAASLAVNLVDAADRDNGSNTEQFPTALRVYKQTAPITGSVRGNYAVSTRLDQGDIPDALLPDQMFGVTGNGVTFFGLDNQPFLLEAHAIAAYQGLEENSFYDGVSTYTNTIVPTDSAQQMGSAIAFELGNPFGVTINCANYIVRLSDGNAIYDFDLGSVAVGGSSLITAGGRTVFYWAPKSADNLTDFATSWDQLRDAWVARVDTTGAASVELSFTALNVVNGPSPYRVAWQALSNATDRPVLLIRKQAGTRLPGDVVVDRLSPPAGADPFPAVQTGNHVLNYTSLVLADSSGAGRTNAEGRIVIASNLYRPTENTEGFPAYVVENRTANTVKYEHPVSGTDGVQALEQKWLMPADVPEVDAALLMDDVSSAVLLLGEDKGAFPNGLPAFQVFVPNEGTGERRKPFFLSDVLRTSAFCTTFLHESNAAYNSTDVEKASDLALNNWTTFSEYLGLDSSRFYAGSGGSLNPYFGVLDPSRFILSDTSMGANMPNGVPAPLSIPLALRVLDLFEPLETVGDLASGRININTAPPGVLELLPLVAPLRDIAGMQLRKQSDRDTYGGPILANTRVGTLLNYRNRLNALTPTGITQLNGLREQGSLPGDPVKGFVTPGELAVLQQWTVGTGNPGMDSQQQYFATLGADGANSSDGDTTQQLDLDVPVYTISGANVNPSDDPEERLAQYRALSNIVSSRSDVFVAWFVLRGYDPEQIEKIEVPGGQSPNDANIRTAMNNAETPFRPQYESRWLVVFDRSNVRKPTDRPRVLLKVELPSAVP